MKTRLALILSVAALLPATGAFAQTTLYWGGGSSNISTNGIGVSQGSVGTWDTSTVNWDAGAGVAHSAWGSGDNAVLAATNIPVGGGIVTLGAAITANSVTISTTNYFITDGGNSAYTLTVNNVTNSQITTISNNLINSATFTKAGSSTLTLLAASPSFTAAINQVGGTLDLGNTAIPGQPGPTGFTSAAVAAGATFKILANSAESFSQVISGAGAFYAQGSNYATVVSLSGANTFTGPVTVNQATLSVNSINDVSACALGNGTNMIIAAGGSTSELTYTGFGDTTARALTLGGTTSGTLLNSSGSGALVWEGPVLFASTNQHTVQLSGTSQYFNIFGGTIPDNISGGVTNSTTIFEKSGTGTWMLAGTNTYSGGTLIAGGTLILSNDYALGSSTGAVAFTGSYTLKSISNNVTLGATRTVTVSNNATANFAVGDTNNFNVAAYLAGPGYVQKASSSYTLGTVRFSNDTNSYTGAFTAGYGNTEFTSVANSGTVSSLGEGLTNGGAITLGNATSAATFRYVGAGPSATTRPLFWTASTAGIALDCTNTGTIAYLNTTSNLVSAAAASQGAKTLTLQGSNTGTNTLGQVINDSTAGATSVTKAGTGQWVLTAADTYSGVTTVASGTLSLSGGGSIANSPTIIVQNGATFNVAGVSAGYTLGSGQTLYATNRMTAATNATLAGNLTLGTASLVIGYTNGTPAVNVTNGTLTLAAGTAVTVVITNGGTPLAGGSYRIISKGTGGAVAGTAPSSVTVAGDGIAGGSTALLAITGGQLFLNVSGGTLYPPVLSGLSYGSTGPVLTFSGTNGQAYVVLTSTNLLTPLPAWTVLSTGTLNGAVMTYTNTTATNSQQFYIIESP